MSSNRNDRPPDSSPRLHTSPTPSFLSLRSTPPTHHLDLGDPIIGNPNHAPRGSNGVLAGLASYRESSQDQNDAIPPIFTVSHTPSTSRESSVDRHSDVSSRSPKRRKRIPREHREAFNRTYSRVKLAQSLLAEVARTGVRLVGEAGEIIPVPGLAIAAKLLNNIWDAVEQIDSNRLACLRLTERCAEILVAVHEELKTADRGVVREMKWPLQQLENSFDQFYRFLDDQLKMSFLARFLKRDEILEDIQACDKALGDALFVFNTRILLRILENLLALPQNSDATVAGSSSLLLSGGEEKSSPVSDVSHDSDLEGIYLRGFPKDDTAAVEVNRIRDEIERKQEHQNELDQARDKAEIRQLLMKALNASNDKEMIRILQLGKHDMPKAIKALLRALESQYAASFKHPTPLMPSRNFERLRGLTWPLDDREKSALDGDYWNTETFDADTAVLKPRRSCPTIRKSEVTRQELIGTGFFSNVYKGAWRHRIVAIKILDRSTTEEAFMAEFDIWKSLNNQNVLRLYGTSGASANNLPWFFVSPYMRNGSLSQYLKRLEWELESSNGNTGFSSDPERRKYDLASELLRYMVDIARGMEYLHGRQIYHGDLKGTNVLVDNNFRCVLADFGHSKWASRVTYNNSKHNHGFRWQSPELMKGRSLLTKENDVYAYAITLVEILTMGSLPWPTLPDDLVREAVLERGERPDYPGDLAHSVGIRSLLEECWQNPPSQRPAFSEIVQNLRAAPNTPSGRTERTTTVTS